MINSKSAGAAFAPMTISDADFARLVKFIQGNYGIDLSQKRQLIVGRLSTALKQKGYASFTDFVNNLLKTKDETEVTLLLDKLTTNYTFFMREQDHLDNFRRTIIPEIVRRHQKDKTLAIWSAGCSTGEEPYNISMYLFDYLGAHAREWDTRLLATDISSRALTPSPRSGRRNTLSPPRTVTIPSPPTLRTMLFSSPLTSWIPSNSGANLM